MHTHVHMYMHMYIYIYVYIIGHNILLTNSAEVRLSKFPGFEWLPLFSQIAPVYFLIRETPLL